MAIKNILIAFLSNNSLIPLKKSLEKAGGDLICYPSLVLSSFSL